MAEREITTHGGKIYFVKESGGKYYISRPGWAGRNSVGSARNLADALAIVENHAQEKVKHVG